MDPHIWTSKSRTTNSVRIRDLALKTCQRWWTIRRSSERGLGISMLAARHDDDSFYVLFILPICIFYYNQFSAFLFPLISVRDLLIIFTRIITDFFFVTNWCGTIIISEVWLRHQDMWQWNRRRKWIHSISERHQREIDVTALYRNYNSFLQLLAPPPEVLSTLAKNYLLTLT